MKLKIAKIYGSAKRIEPDRVIVPRGSTTDRIFCGPVPTRSGGTYLFIVAATVAGALSNVSNFLLALLKGEIRPSPSYGILSCTRKRDEPRRKDRRMDGRKGELENETRVRKKEEHRNGETGREGKRKRRRRKASASNADIRHTTSNAGAARWRLDRPTLKTPVDQP